MPINMHKEELDHAKQHCRPSTNAEGAFNSLKYEVIDKATITSRIKPTVIKLDLKMSNSSTLVATLQNYSLQTIER